MLFRSCTIPWEILDEPHRPLYIGVYGTKDERIVLPTVWASCGTSLEGTKLGNAAQEPSPSVYEQVLAQLENKADGLEYDGLDLALMSGEKTLSSVPLVGGGGGNISSVDIQFIRVMERAEYDALPEKDNKTIYFLWG